MSGQDGPLDPRPTGLGLTPTSTADVHALFDLLCETMGRAVSGHEDPIDRLALLGVRHLARDLYPPTGVLRALLIGPSGSGKSTLARAFADAVGLPTVVIAGQAMAEMNWAGSDVADSLRRLYEGVEAAGSLDRAIELAERAVVVIDGLDALRLPGPYGGGASRDYQLGRQQSLVPVIGNGEVPLDRSLVRSSWPSARALVIACGVFEGLRDGAPSAEDLTDWGLIPELGDRLGGGTVLRLSAPARIHLPAILGRSLEGSMNIYAAFGYELSVSPEAIQFVADRIIAGSQSTGIRGANGWIADAADRALVEMVRSGVPAGALRVLAPDDIQVITTPRGLWRE